MVTGPFRLVLKFPGNDQKYFYWREGEARVDGQATTRPQFSPDPLDAKHMHFSTEQRAVACRNRLRNFYPGYSIFIERVQDSLGPLFETPCDTQAQADQFAERPNMQCNGILIRPATARRWCIRFSNNIESLYSEPGGTPESVYEKLITLFPQLVQFAEKHIERDLTPEEFRREVQRGKRARFPGRRRPGDMR